jgi:hypothetical protein
MHMSAGMSRVEEEQEEFEPTPHLMLVEDEPRPAACCSCAGPAVVRFAENDFCGDCFHRVSSDLFGPRY